ncbi:MAG: sugar phosphate isomerase/epimerase family protein [Lachnospiraceae bacterium]
MKVKELLIIPQMQEMEKFLALAKQYGAGFEYNDFFLPSMLDDEKTLMQRMHEYQKCMQAGDYPSYCNLHGVFLDITIFSDDSRIRRVSDERIRQSLDIAKTLNCKSVIFHTNYLANFLQESYRANWVSRNEAYFRQICGEYPLLTILMENMFDSDAILLAQLAERMKDVSNFGVCFDYAHAHVFGDATKIMEWVEQLAPYTKHLHINDNHLICDDHLALGDGKLDWNRFKECYETHFPQASVLLEVSGVEKAEKSLQFLKNL